MDRGGAGEAVQTLRYGGTYSAVDGGIYAGGKHEMHAEKEAGRTECILAVFVLLFFSVIGKASHKHSPRSEIHGMSRSRSLCQFVCL